MKVTILILILVSVSHICAILTGAYFHEIDMVRGCDIKGVLYTWHSDYDYSCKPNQPGDR